MNPASCLPVAAGTSSRNLAQPLPFPHVPVERVPQELREEGESELGGDVRDVLDVRHLQLLLDGERVQEVAAEHDGVGARVHGVDPP